VLGLASARESLDDDHAAAAARAWPRQHAGFIDRYFGRLGLFCGSRQSEQLARVRNVFGSVAVGEQPIVSDAMEARRQHVDQEAPDELVSRQRHRLVAGGALDPIVLVLEGDAVLVGGHQLVIGDRDAVGVARQIAQHLAGPGERLLRVDHPIDLAQWCQIGLNAALSASRA
jgi:hypothetical protein